MSSQEYIRSVTEMIPDDFPTLTPLPEGSSTPTSMSNPYMNYFTNISWQTWIIIILILALLGINIFAYLAKGTQETATLFDQIFGPILRFFGYTTISTTTQTIETTATGTKAGVDIIANTSTNALNTVQERALETSTNSLPTPTTGTSVGVSTESPQGQMASSSLPVQQSIQQAGANIDKWQEDSLSKALQNAKQSADIQPDDSRSSIQSTGKSGWCYIGDDNGIRTCAEIGVNDVCMSGDIFPNQTICMNPNLRA